MLHRLIQNGGRTVKRPLFIVAVTLSLGHSLRHLIDTVTELRRRRPDEYTGEALPRVRCTPSDGLSAKHWPDAWPVRRSHSRQRHGEPATKPPPTIPDGVRWSGPRTRPAELIKSTVIRERNACVERMTYALGGPKFWPEWGGYPDAPNFPQVIRRRSRERGTG